MLRRIVEKSSTLITSEPLRCSRYMHYYFQSGELIPLILPMRMQSTLTVETQLLSNEKFGNRSSENVPLNLNLLVSIFLSLLISFSCSILVFGFYVYSFAVTFEKNSVCYIRFPFPYSVFYFALPSLYPCLLSLFQFALRPFTKNPKRRKNNAT